MAISKITTSGVATDTLVAADLAPNSVDSSELVDGAVDLSHMSVNSIDSDQYVDASIDTAHLASNIAISTSGNIATTGSGTLTVAGTSALNGDVSMSKNKKLKQQGAFMQSSTHQALTLGG